MPRWEPIELAPREAAGPAEDAIDEIVEVLGESGRRRSGLHC